jgi:hypothetical protein
MVHEKGLRARRQLLSELSLYHYNTACDDHDKVVIRSPGYIYLPIYTFEYNMCQAA